MPQENNTVFAILGLLTQGCRTGYSIKQMIDNSLNHFWKISYGQIYPTLKLIVDKGYATVQINAQENRPDKKEYSITPEGEKSLKAWLEYPIDELPTEKNELLLKLFFSRHQDTKATVEQLDTYKKKLKDRLNTYVGIKEMIHCQPADQDDAPFWIITLNYGIGVTTAAIDWCDDTMENLLKLKER